jgi:hypothetical protein
MGLLDDAIRDHLELKRLSGADPRVIDREEREALDPVLGDEEADRQADVSIDGPGLTPEAEGEIMTAETRQEGGLINPHAPSHRTDASNTGQETAELDMRTVLHEHEAAPPTEASPDDPGIDAAAMTPLSDHDEDSLDWEIRAEPSGGSPADLGQHVPYTQRP